MLYFFVYYFFIYFCLSPSSYLSLSLTLSHIPHHSHYLFPSSSPSQPISFFLCLTLSISLSFSLFPSFHSDWNPQNDLQAQARAHRIGQTKPVKVYRLLTRKTYETMMFKAASIKLGLDYAVMHNMHGQGGASVEGIDKKIKHSKLGGHTHIHYSALQYTTCQI